MMQNTCNSYHVVGGSCSCGWFYNNPNTSYPFVDESDHMYPYSYASSPPSSSSVDCTLSLGTPSTRSNHVDSNVVMNEKRKPKFFNWNFLRSSKSHHKNEEEEEKSYNTSNYSNSYSGNGDGGSHFARRCANCDTTSTPLWRNGPKGPKSLCNACGIRYKKEEKRAASAAAVAANSSDATGDADTRHVLNSSWVPQSENQMMPYISSVYNNNEFSYTEDIDDSGNPFFFRRLNVH